MDASKQSNPFSHLSTLSPVEYRIGVSNLISRNVRAFGGAFAVAFFPEDVDAVAAVSSSAGTASFVREGRVLSRSC